MRHTFPFILLLLVLFTACVPGRRFQEVQTEARLCSQEREALRQQTEELSADLADCRTGNETMKKEYVRLKEDTALLGTSLRRMTVQYDKINELNEQLMDKQASLMSSRESEKRELLENLLTLQNDLQEQQRLLNQTETELNEKTRALEDREERVAELESLLSRQEEAVQSLKSRVTDALLGVKDKGITIVEKDGRVYVSLDAKLLFASGSTAVSSEGKSAIIDLAKAIQDEEDLKILVEGHTDTDKIIGNSAPYKDNWDLSVMRATSVVRIMMDNSNIDPQQLTAAGRSEYLPVDPDDKAKNRRIEIILIPNLTELFDLINEQ
ncbi:MAG: OmpA family protein [Flavobacteriales bacterium]|nr:OmpA family protein [Flavobacteriales bacterium]